MTQVTNYNVANGPRAGVREGFNNVLAALRDSNAGPTAPPNPVPFMLWMDTSTSPAVLKVRNLANDAWQTMASVVSAYNQSNILGTVSMPAGVPTGALIQTGTTASARFMRFADGTMICAGSFSGTVAHATAYAGMFRGTPTAVTFPSTFAAAPFIKAGNNTNSGADTIITGAIAVTAANFTPLSLRGASAASAAYSGHYVAIGRWV